MRIQVGYQTREIEDQARVPGSLGDWTKVPQVRWAKKNPGSILEMWALAQSGYGCAPSHRPMGDWEDFTLLTWPSTEKT